MRRVGFLVWKELIELKAGSAPLRHRHPRADPAAVHARLRGDDRRARRAGRGRRRRSIGGEPRADRALRRVAELHDRRRRHRRAARSIRISSAGTRVDGAGDSGRLRRRARRAAQPQAVQVIADGSDANSAGVALGYATNLIAAYAQELAARRVPPVDDDRAAGIEPRVRVWFNPRLESRDFMMPGVLALLLLVDHDQPVVDGHRAREGARHARAAERHAAAPLGADRRQAAAVRAGRAGRRRAWCSATAVFWFEVPLRGSVVAAVRR